jgi:hypothetical protein
MNPLKEAMDRAKLHSKKDFLAYKNSILPKLQKRTLKKSFFAETSGIFVGEYGYPNVQIGVLSTEQYNHNNDVSFWVDEKWQLSQIAEARLDLINSKKKTSVYQPSLTEQQELALAKRPASVEITLEKEPAKAYTYSDYHMPLGPSAALQTLKLGENPKIPTSVQKIISDEIKATEGINYLYTRGHTQEYLSQILSAGTMGIDKKFVPTRWSITATDDMIGKKLIATIKDFPMLANYVYTGSYLGNYFIVLLLDGSFSFELFEFFRDTDSYTTDYEGIHGRTTYATETAGGYYASRLSVCEKLQKLKKQSRVLVLRFITDEYYMPLGVWVVRKAVEQTMSMKPLEFGSEELLLHYAFALARKKFNRDISWLHKKSNILAQRTLGGFL